jgi:hypothetical protein
VREGAVEVYLLRTASLDAGGDVAGELREGDRRAGGADRLAHPVALVHLLPSPSFPSADRHRIQPPRAPRQAGGLLRAAKTLRV